MKSGVLVTIAAVSALMALAAPANATHVQCGDTLTETTVLDSDLVCANAGGGLRRPHDRADGVILWMNGHTLRSETGYGTGVMVPNHGPGFEYDNIQIRRGSFQGWTKAIDMSNSDSAVLKVSISEPGYPVDLSGTQIKVVGDRNYLARNYVNGSLYRQLPDDEVGVRGISIQGDDAYTWGNTFLRRRPPVP